MTMRVRCDHPAGCVAESDATVSKWALWGDDSGEKHVPDFEAPAGWTDNRGNGKRALHYCPAHADSAGGAS